MRRLLLTTAAALGASMGFVGSAYAQSPTVPPPPNAGYGVGGLGAPPPTATVAPASGVIAPNSFVVHLNGRINWYAGVEGDSSNGLAGFKNDPYQFQGYIRLYPGFDAVAANGLQYGVVSETRMPGSTFEGAGDSPGATSGTDTVYWRRAYGYVGTAEVGTFRFGMGDGPMDIFQTGTFEGFNDGAWNGDVPFFVPGSTEPSYPFADVGAYYTVNRVVYLSPSFSGFQFGIGFAPNTSNLWNAQCSVAGPTCNNLSASPDAANQKRWRNMIDAGGTYTGTFGPVGLALGGGFVASNSVNYDGGVAPLGSEYNGFSFGQFGGTVTFAGFTVGGNIGYGKMNGDYSLQPKGGQNELAFMVGGQYAAGPFVVGASYFKTKYAGGWTYANALAGVARTETDQGVAAGGTYDIAPGMALYLSYLYGLRHQVGYDFYTGDPGTVGNNTHSQVFSIGTVLKW